MLSAQAVVGGAWTTGRPGSYGKCVCTEWPGRPCLGVCGDLWLWEDGIFSAVFGLLWYLRKEA